MKSSHSSSANRPGRRPTPPPLPRSHHLKRPGLCPKAAAWAAARRLVVIVRHVQKRAFFYLQNKLLQGVLFHRFAIILVYHARILLERLEVPMPRILLHLDDVGTARQVVGDMGRAQVVNMAPPDARPSRDRL